MQEDVRVRELTKAGAVIGPAIVGSVVGNGLYTISHGPGIPAYYSRANMLHVIALVASLAAAWTLRDRLARLSWATFGAFNAAILLAPGRLPPAIVATCYLVVGAMLTASGMRHVARFGSSLAAAVFLAVAVLAFAARYYGAALLGRHSVL